MAACGLPAQAPSTTIQTPVHSPSVAPASPRPQASQPTSTVAVTTAPATTTPPSPTTLPTPQLSATMTGTVSYPPELTLPPYAMVTIKLLEVRPNDRPSEVIIGTTTEWGGGEIGVTEKTFELTGPGPIPFAIKYDPTHIDPQQEYVISAEANHEGQLLFAAPRYPVLTQGHPATVEVMLQAPPILRGTVSYPAQPALPPDAMLTVQLVNQSLCEDLYGCLILGEQTITPNGQSPTPFALAYNSAIIDPQWSYVLIARISAPGGRNWWVEQPAPVLTQGHPATVDLTIALPPAVATVTGTVSYPAQPALPPGAVLTVQLLALSDDGLFGPPVVSEQTIPLDGRSPTPFTIAYDPSKIDPLWSYAVDARISAPGRLDWRAEQSSPVLTQGHPATVEVTVEPPPAVAAVSGTVTYPAQPALPPDAVLEIQLVNIKRTDTADWVLGAARITPVRPGPIPFTLEYNPTYIDPQEQYVVYAVLYMGKQLPFVTTTPYPVITHGHPTTVDAVLQESATGAAFSGTIAYHAERPLPPNATLVIEVEGFIGDDVPYSLGRQEIASVGPGPIPFAIQYDSPTSDPNYVYPRHVHPKAYTYWLTARIYAGKVDFSGDTVRPEVLFAAAQPVLMYVPIDVPLE